MNRVRCTVLAVAIAGMLVACGDDGTPAATTAGGATLTIDMKEYAFAVTGSARGGRVTISARNSGKELHEVAMGKLKDGKTLDDLRTTLANADPEDEDSLAAVLEEDSTIDDAGGILTPGSAIGVTITGVEAGSYALICFLPDPQGKPHFASGMVAPLTVAEGPDAPAPTPTASYTITNEKLEGPATLKAGAAVLSVTNGSTATREFSIIKVKEGKTLSDVDAFFRASEESDGPPDFSAAPVDYFAFVFDAEQDRLISVNLTPGTWAINTPDPDEESEAQATEDPYVVQVTVT